MAIRKPHISDLFVLIIFIFIGMVIPSSCASMTAQEQYINADASFLKLKKDPAKQNSRQGLG